MPILDIDATLALRHFNQSEHSRWSSIAAAEPGDGLGSDFFRPRLQKTFSLTSTSAGYVLGSCFAQEIQLALGRRGVPLRSSILDSPKESWFLQAENAGTIDAGQEGRAPATDRHYYPLHFFHRFSPPAMLQELENILAKSPAIANGELIFERPDGSFADYHYDPSFVLAAREDCLERRQFVRERLNALIDVDYVILTFGLTEAWLDSATGLYLNRPPRLELVTKFPARFRLHLLTETESFDSMRAMLELLCGANPDMRIVVTVSPVPLAATFTGADVAVANACSKATLLCAVHRLRQAFPRILYFPSYEIATHSDRRVVWTPDGRHVRAEFVRRIMDFFCREVLEGGPGGDAPVSG